MSTYKRLSADLAYRCELMHDVHLADACPLNWQCPQIDVNRQPMTIMSKRIMLLPRVIFHA